MWREPDNTPGAPLDDGVADHHQPQQQRRLIILLLLLLLLFLRLSVLLVRVY